MKVHPDRTEIAERLACCAEELDASEQQAALALFRMLAEGAPVEQARLADRLGLDDVDLTARLSRRPGVHLDPDGRIVAFEGLSVVETAHRLQVDGRTLYAWCAWDTLFLPELIGRPASVESTCPATGEPITLRVEPEGPRDVAPATAVLSFLLPDGGLGGDTIATFCNFIHFFSDPEAAAEWTADRPGTFVISIEDGFEVGRRVNAAQWGDG
jgi:alkylmercury lyase